MSSPNSSDSSRTANEVFRPRDGLWHQGSVSEQADELKEAIRRDAKGEGLKLLAQGSHQAAVPVLESYVAQNPNDGEAKIALGRALCLGSRWPAAEPHLADAVRLLPRSPEAHFEYGDVLLKVGKFTAAIKHFEECLKRLPWIDRLKKKIHRLTADLVAMPPVTNPDTRDPAVKLAFARMREAGLGRAKKACNKGTPNRAWNLANRGRTFKVKNQPLVKPDTKIFAIGSCFALEIRHELARRKYDVYPKYTSMEFDTSSQIACSLPERDNINHYDTFTIRQEFEQAFGNTHYAVEDFWSVEGRGMNKVFRKGKIWQDPYRKNVYATEQAGILDLSQKLDGCLKEGIMNADVYVITLGLIETWRYKKNGLHVCTYPGVGGGGGQEETELHVAGFDDNYDNLKRVCELVFSHFPNKHIIFTVSPVALEYTFRDVDIVIANMESKATLRAVAGQITREFSNAHYFPSFELFAYHDLFHDNGRHATRDGVKIVLDTFGRCFFDHQAESQTIQSK
jgi:tetratricopeptide (TPR) repeat protein